jgi:hypothetical protein
MIQQPVPPQPSAGEEELNRLYLQRLGDYDRRAVHLKQWYRFVWMLASVSTWLSLLLAIICLTRPGADLLNWVTLSVLIPCLGGLAFLSTVVQTFFGLQSRWLRYRTATERLRGACMLYRARLAPFDGPDAVQRFYDEMNDLERVLRGDMGQRFTDRFRWRYYLNLVAMPPELCRPLPHTPDLGVAPRLGDPSGLPVHEHGEQLFLAGRLQSQRQWHLRKARLYFLGYLVFQCTIMAISLFSGFIGLVYGRAFALVAITTAFNLMLLALRDFLDFGPLFHRYVRLAGNLGEIELEFRAPGPLSPSHSGVLPPVVPPKPPEPVPAPSAKRDPTQEKLRQLVQNTEEALSSDFQRWYASRR